MEKNQEFELAVTDMSEDGAGIGKTFDACFAVNGKREEPAGEQKTGFAWFVKDTVPGDRIRAAATKVKKNYGFARLIRVLEPSSDRTEPLCENARACGGCQLQQITYGAQLAFKAGKAASALTRIGGFSLTDGPASGSCPGLPQEGTIVFEPIIGMDDPWRYRNKAQYPVGRDRNGKIITGFYAGHTHSVIACRDCKIGSEKDREILNAVTGWMTRFKVDPYDETTLKGVVRHVLIRTSRSTGEVMVCLVINAQDIPHRQELLGALERAGAATVSLSINKKNTNVILGEKTVCLSGEGFITDAIGGITFHISPQSFFQVNPVQVEKLYGKALEYAGLTGRETVWDLYCGVGTISLFMAKHAKKVYGVEIVPQAIEDARDNAERNGLHNTEFFVGKAEEVVPAWMEKSGKGDDICHPDVICVDPPRKGCDEKCLETILAAAPERIVYVSCDPATLARDLKYLCANGYALKKVCPVDMFPQTVHVEVVCLLSKLSEAKHHVEVELNADDMEATSVESKATYEEIREYVKAKTGLHVTNLNIAKVKRKCGIIERENYNLPKSDGSKQPNCTEEKEEAIMEAFRHFGMI